MTTTKTFRATTTRTVYETGEFEFELEVDEGFEDAKVWDLAFTKAEELLDTGTWVEWECSDTDSELVEDVWDITDAAGG